MAEVPVPLEPALPEPANEDRTLALNEVQREMLEHLTGARWLLNPNVPAGSGWLHPAGPSDPAIGPDTTIPTYIIHPSDLTTCLAAVVSMDVPGSRPG